MTDINITGIRWPLAFSAGRVMISHNDQHIAESIRQIIATNKLEYLMKPDFGSNLGTRVFDPVNLLPLARTDIAEALRRWEPRAELADVSLDISRAPEGLIFILIDYRIAGNLQQMQIDFSNYYPGGSYKSIDNPIDPIAMELLTIRNDQ